MRYISFAIGYLKLLLYKLLFGNRFDVKITVVFDARASVMIKKNGSVKLGDNVSLAKDSSITANEEAVLIIGSESGINQNTKIVASKSIKIGSYVMIGPNVCIYDHDHDYVNNYCMKKGGYVCEDVVIEDNVWIGAGVIILKGVTIGSGSVIGAGCIVTKDIPKNKVVYNKCNLHIKERSIRDIY